LRILKGFYYWHLYGEKLIIWIIAIVMLIVFLALLAERKAERAEPPFENFYANSQYLKHYEQL